MKSKARYSLIAAGIVAFIVLSPFVYLFVRGDKYDFKNHRFVGTGTLSASTDPKGAHIFLDGKEAGTTNTSVRFITPGDYNLELKKDGYLTWSKRINIREQFVTWANLNLTAITLFFSEPKKTVIADNVSNLFAGENRLIYLQKNKILIADTDSPANPQTINLPDAYANFEIIPSKDENYFLLKNLQFTTVLDARAGTLSDITDLLKKQAAFSSTSTFQASQEDLKFSDSDELYQLQAGSVYNIDWRNQNKNVILDNVLAFYPIGQNIYYISTNIQQGKTNSSLLRAEKPNYQPTELINNLPFFHAAELFLTDRKQLFILGDDSLYSLDDGVKKISDYTTAISIDNDNKKILFSSNNEINSYDLSDGSTSLITRSSRAIQNPISVFKLGWVFMQSDGRLQAIEIDNRDHQNNYTFANISDSAKYFVDQKAKNIFLLNNGELSQLVIR